jgi:UDP-2,3-diacylglucosamine pyrophosphatase LpxH
MVLLGDIFDIIRSAQWLAGAVRPWDAAGPLQGQIVRRILDDIITNNQKSLGYFDNLREYAAKMGVPFDITYVIGNHDWLVNRYPDCRAAAAKALGIAAGGVPFPSQLFEPGYKVFARHGDYYDEFNYTGDRDASSIGDAIVIELLNRYPQEAARRLTALVNAGSVTIQEMDGITSQLKELDNIRPLLDAPSWVVMVANKTENEAARRAIEQAWEDCVDNFFTVPFVQSQDKFLWPDKIDLLQIALQLSSHTSKKMLEKIVELKEKLFPGDQAGGYDNHAFQELRVRSGDANFVLYGHTHDGPPGSNAPPGRVAPG